MLFYVHNIVTFTNAMFSAKIFEPIHSLIPYVIAGRNMCLYISVLLVRVQKGYSYVVHTVTKNLKTT